MSDAPDGAVYMDSNWYTPREIKLIEAKTGKPIDKMMQGEGPKGDEIRVVALVMRRRDDPDFPEEQADDIPVIMTPRPVPPTGDNGSEPSSPLSSTTE